jgi:hypothetical protein
MGYNTQLLNRTSEIKEDQTWLMKKAIQCQCAKRVARKRKVIEP